MKNKFVKYILSVAVASCMTGCFDLDHEEFYNIDADAVSYTHLTLPTTPYV